MTTAEQNRSSRVLDEVLGLGPFEAASEGAVHLRYSCQRFDKVYIERGGRLSRTAVRFKDNAHPAAHH